eukprot:13657-Heterococcus_DN1.PRE.1
MVLNALEIDPGRLWKGNWRWYSESVLESCEPLEVIKDRGISYRKLACLARCNGAACSVRDGATVSLDEFRRIVKHITGGGHGKCHLVIAYDRKVLGQTGGGHFSPIGAYNSEHDKVLIMDVARFKYSAHWVSLDTVWHAMQAIEQATGKARGMMVIYRQDRKGLLFTVCREAFQQWPQSAQWWRECIDKVSSAVTSAAVTAASVTTAEPLQSTQLQQQLDSQLNAFVKQFLTALPQQALQLVAAHKTHTHTAATTTASNTADTAKEVQQLELEQPPAIPRAQSCMKITPDRLMIALESSAVFKTVTDVHNTSTISHKASAAQTQSAAIAAIGQPDVRHLLTVLILATAFQSAMDLRAAGFTEHAGKVLAMFHLLDAQQILLSDVEHVAK